MSTDTTDDMGTMLDHAIGLNLPEITPSNPVAPAPPPDPAIARQLATAMLDRHGMQRAIHLCAQFRDTPQLSAFYSVIHDQLWKWAR